MLPAYFGTKGFLQVVQAWLIPLESADWRHKQYLKTGIKAIRAFYKQPFLSILINNNRVLPAK